MGYTSTCEGEIKISPPLNHQELKALPDLEEPYGAEIELVIEESEEETSGGTLITRKATAIRPRDEGENWKRYYTTDQLKAIVEAYPHHVFTGYFEFLGEDGDRWRTVIKNGKVIDDVKPKLEWPES